MAVFVEQECETLLKTAFQSVISSWNNDKGTSYDPSYRRFWSDDASGEDEEQIKFPHIEIGAAPNTPRGYQEPLRQVPVAVTIGTLLVYDRKREDLASLYQAIREAIDSRNFNQDTSALKNVEVTVFDGGEISEDNNGSYVNLNLTLEVCTG